MLTDLLERNAATYCGDVALVELNPATEEKKKSTWKEYSLVEQSSTRHYRREITWGEFNEQANRVSHFLMVH